MRRRTNILTSASRLGRIAKFGLIGLAFHVGSLSAQTTTATDSGAVEKFEGIFDTAIVVQPAPGEFGITELMNAALDGDLDRVDALIRSGADVNAKDFRGDTALVRAVAYGHTAIVNRLIAAGADLNAGSKRGSKALGHAVQAGDIEQVRTLLSQGADPNTNLPSTQKPILEYAAVMGRGEIVGALLEHGVDVQTHGPAALNLALWKGYEDIAAALVVAGVDVNAPPFDSEKIRHSQSGESALQTAAQGGHVGSVELLLKYGADLNAADRRGQTALGYALSTRHPKVVDLLLSKGASVSARDLSKALGAGDLDAAASVLDALVLRDVTMAELESLIADADSAAADSIIEKLFDSRANLRPEMKRSRLLFARVDGNDCRLVLWDLASNSERIIYDEADECASEFFVSDEKRSLFVKTGDQLQIISLSDDESLDALSLPTELMKSDLAELLAQVRASYQTQISDCCSWMAMKVASVGHLPSGEIGLVTHVGGPADETYRHIYEHTNGSWRLIESDSCHRFDGCMFDEISGRSLNARPTELTVWHPDMRTNPYFHSKSSISEPKGDYDTWSGRVVLSIDGSVSEILYSNGASDHCFDDCIYTDGLKLRISGRPDRVLANYSGNNSFADRYVLVRSESRGHSELIDLKTGESVLGEMSLAGWVQ